MHKMEILAPAGDEEMLRAAVFSGADCVYLGVEGFNARRGAGNFGPDTLEQAVAFCHARNCGVFAAVNTLALPGELPRLQSAIELAVAAGVDAVIVQDLATAELTRRVAPGLALHASTQMSVHSLVGVEMLARLGFSRAILARELSRQEIEKIAMKSPIELEIFVHGALCVCLSGQCYMSALLGGRSANRGACAGPCRLPFSAVGPGGGRRHHAEDHHLSLKDLSILEELPALAKLGVAAAKIEGRLRGPEYCATAVDAARKALNEEQYDKELLQKVFSRNGFTQGWYLGKTGKQMFGTRSEAEHQAGKKAQAKARELYRRERPRVPLRVGLELGPQGGRLWASDGEMEVALPVPGPLPAEQKDNTAALRASLEKMGGTPFYLPASEALEIKTQGRFLAAGQAGALRRQLLAKLLQMREEKKPKKPVQNRGKMQDEHISVENSGTHVDKPLISVMAEGAATMLPGGKTLLSTGSAAGQAAGPAACPPLLGRFANWAQVPPLALDLCAQFSLPLRQAAQIPPPLRGRTWLRLPRALFGPAEAEAARQVAQTCSMGFLGYEAQNLAHLKLCEGLPLMGGFGLNITNGVAAGVLTAAGCAAVTFSPELSGRQMRELAGQMRRYCPGEEPATAALAYGHLPLMITRACPLANAAPAPQKEPKNSAENTKQTRKNAQFTAESCGAEACKVCPAQGTLHDRKGEAFPLRCRGGVSTIYNPVPLWLAERLGAWPADVAVLHFSIESAAEAAEILAAFTQRGAAPFRFTRGLFEKGVSP